MVGQLLLQLFLILLNAVFACAEIAIISINDNKLEKMAASGDKRAARLTRLTEQPARFLATIQIGITLAGFLGSAFAADNFAGSLVNGLVSLGVKLPHNTLNAISVVFITLILSYITLIFGELVPKRIAMQKAEPLGLAMSGLISFISKAFRPIVWFLTASTNLILCLMGIDPDANDDEVTEEEIRMMVDVGGEKGTIDLEEREFIHNIFDFDNKNAEEVMTHRTEVSLLWLDETDEQWEKTIFESRHSTYPICNNTADDVIGILNTKDYFRLKDKSRESIMKNAVKQPYFIPDSVKADVLLRNMKKNRTHFAIVLDEYGGMSGIITINDLLEELVGDFDDDDTFSQEQPEIDRIDSHTWKISGSASLDMVSKQLGTALPTDDYDTFGGFVFGLLGAIPDNGATPELEEYGLLIKVIEVKSHRLERAVVRLVEKPADAEQ